MATTTSPRHGHLERPRDRDTTRSKPILWAVPVGRVLYGLIFVFSSINLFSGGSVSYAEAQGVPLPAILVPVAGAIALVGGLSVVLGAHARYGALLLLLFLLPVTFIMHDFWNVSDALMAQNEMAHFMKNISMIGTAILLWFYGAGPVSMDHRKAKHHH